MMPYNLRNVITEPIRVIFTNTSSTRIDPIAITNTIEVFDAGVFNTIKEISDHFGTYAYNKYPVENNKNCDKRQVGAIKMEILLN